MYDTKDQSLLYKVLINSEEQYSLWSANMEIPQGWTYVGITGSELECLKYIEDNWHDMRPLSVRN